ncbi:hypothetical protein CLV99_1042 [Sphingobacterium yanglingense]|uniref:Uncharacterized protein n=1 Tax=Sphingobacterium yanglingense TaxID=1437280 RepID=A0A4R6WKW6_9SPHI|nr:hypothetical protein CLV99_1042 [Sphingobacterium yanglingense]
MEIEQVLSYNFFVDESKLVGNINVILTNGQNLAIHARMDKNLDYIYTNCHPGDYSKIWDFWCNNNSSRIPVKKTSL